MQASIFHVPKINGMITEKFKCWSEKYEMDTTRY